MAVASGDNPLLEQLKNDYSISNEPGYPAIRVPTSPDGHMTKVVWPRMSFPKELHRWNLPEEILSYLISFDSHEEWVTTVIPNKPPSGTMRLFDKRKTKNYKVDGYDWKTRKRQASSVREDRTKLRVCGHILLYALYTHCESNPAFHRRIYWLIKNPSITVVHYLDTSRTSRKVTPASLKRQSTDQACHEDVIMGPPVASTALLAVSDQTLCKYLFSFRATTPQSSLNELIHKIRRSALELYQREGPVTTATFITYVQKALFPEGSDGGGGGEVGGDQASLMANVALFDQAMKLIQLQRGCPQQVLLPKGTTEKMASADVLRAAAILLAQAENKVYSNGQSTPATPTLSSVLAMVRPLLGQATPTTVLPTQSMQSSSQFMPQVPAPPTQVPPAQVPLAQLPPTPVTPTQTSSEDSEYLSFLHPPSLDTLKSVLPEPLDIDHSVLAMPTSSTTCNMSELTHFAESLLTMRPLAEAERLRQQESGQTGLTGTNTSFASSDDVEMIPGSADLLSDNFLDHFLEELTNGVPPTHDNELLGLTTSQNGGLAPPTQNEMPPTHNSTIHNGIAPPSYDSIVYNVPPTQNDLLPPTHNQAATPNPVPHVDQTLQPEAAEYFPLELDPESLKILIDLYNEEREDDEVPLPLSPTSQYMASFNGQETSAYGHHGDGTGCPGNEIANPMNSAVYGETAVSVATNLVPMTTNSVPNPVSMATSIPLFGGYNFMSSSTESHNLQFANSLLQQPPHLTPVSSQSPRLSPMHVPVYYRSSSPIQSPPSPSQASVSSLSTGGGDSESSLVAELCELMSESPNVQQEDFSHLSLSGPEQQELLQASRVIQKTLRRCKERPNSMVTFKEKNAALLIERSYKRYRELKRRRDEAARCIQTQYRQYRRRTEELQRAALFIQQMYRYQRRRRVAMSSLATHSQTSSSFHFR